MTAPDCSDGGDELFRDARALQIWGFPLVFAQRLRLRFTPRWSLTWTGRSHRRVQR
ncbi:hypothetical protein [Rhodococcus sp. SORGH_AS_0303]|uniref:hypothetical protein n=1 Tax=Rhodococcus sp. SORGH_AS_0303 TaxID=3041753 RepID=UPI0027819717|nr:hypothetical protein [Rhodococcus sp. SORGH_AS_0303]MDQ1203081.1 hypothetical protein [Rhodococcus sp. SORGH_AS_0303]